MLPHMSVIKMTEFQYNEIYYVICSLDVLFDWLRRLFHSLGYITIVGPTIQRSL